MSSDATDSEAGDEGSSGRTRVRLILVTGCILTVILASLLVPTLGSGELAGSPIDSVLPGEPFDTSEGGGGGFGALSPGDQTGIGGETGFDSETFGSNDTSVHFEVESSEPAYWRTGTFDTYTGSGWESSGETSPLEPPLDPVGLTDGSMEFEVTLAKSATAIPTAWQPRDISGIDGGMVTDGGAIRVSEPLDPGTTISGVSQVQENDVDLLRLAGQSYPEAIDGQYTQLPADTPERVERFTQNLTADDETPYDAARSIQEWLRAEKDYSLQASRESENIADTFIFEMEAGYCEYFATAMTTMLRSQDIPARYTIGYTTGQEVGNDTYEVRGMNAHAWVEVYFPDVGWVRFDPTPGDSRLESQSDVLEEQVDGEFDLEEPGGPGETFRPDEIVQNDTTDDPDGSETEGAFDISLNRTAVPGFPVEIEVTEDGEPVSGLTVTVNGEPVGTTDDRGTIVITVPDTEELDISVRTEDERADVVAAATGGDAEIASPSADGAGVAPSGSSTVAGGTSVVLGSVATETDATDRLDRLSRVAQQTGEANRTVQVERNATLSVTGETLPGEQVTLTATVRDVTIPGAAVYLDGERVGTTDESGRLNLTLPATAGDLEFTVERGSISGSETVTIPAVRLAVDPPVIPLPFTTATVTVSAGEEPVAGAAVVVDGERVGTTDADGRTDVRLPLSPTARIESTVYGMSATATVDGLLRNLGLTAGGVLVGVVLPVVVVRRRGWSPTAVPRQVYALYSRGVTYAQRLLITVARYSGAWLVAVPGRLRTTVAYAVDVLRGRVDLGELRRLFLAWLRRKRRRIDTDTDAESDGEQDVDVVDGIQAAWLTFLSHLSIADPSGQTPGELAAHAVRVDGYPSEAVETLLVAFREVEYGARPEPERLDSVEQALAHIETSRQSQNSDSGAERSGGPVSADGGRAEQEDTGTETADERGSR